MASLVNLPKQALEFKAKKKIEVEDSTHESSIKRGETFYILQKDKDFFLYDQDGKKYVKFKLTRAKYKELVSSHTLVTAQVEVRKVPTTRKRTIATVKESATDIRRRRHAAIVKSRGLLDQIDVFAEFEGELASIEKLPELQRANYLSMLVLKYEEAGVTLNAHSANFIADLNKFLSAYSTLKGDRPRFIYLKNVFRKLSAKYRINLSGDTDVLEVLQKRTTSFEQPRINYGMSPAN